MQRSQQLLEQFHNEISVYEVIILQTTFKIDTNINSQNDHVYSVETQKEHFPERRLIQEREHLSRGIMVSVDSWCVSNGENKCCVR